MGWCWCGGWEERRGPGRGRRESRGAAVGRQPRGARSRWPFPQTLANQHQFSSVSLSPSLSQLVYIRLEMQDQGSYPAIKYAAHDYVKRQDSQRVSCLELENAQSAFLPSSARRAFPGAEKGPGRTGAVAVSVKWEELRRLFQDFPSLAAVAAVPRLNPSAYSPHRRAGLLQIFSPDRHHGNAQIPQWGLTSRLSVHATTALSILEGGLVSL